MTMQVPGSCIFEGRKFVIEHWDGSTDCIPSNEELGISTISPSTANWSGRIDHFLVYHGKLYLFKIEVTLDPDKKHSLPDKVRREVQLRYQKMHWTDSQGQRIIEQEYRYEFLIYDDLVIPFTGSLRLSYPYLDCWNVPCQDEDDEETAEEIVLVFVEGVLQ
jgi:hypothetical protein